MQDWEARLEISSIRADPTPITPGGKEKLFHRFIRGIAKGGKVLLIYPCISRKEQMPKAICEEMLRVEAAGGIVGCADGISDAWDVAINDPVEYPRKQKSYLYRWWGNRYKQGEDNGKREEE